jgi:hypothetical protein
VVVGGGIEYKISVIIDRKKRREKAGTASPRPAIDGQGLSMPQQH